MKPLPSALALLLSAMSSPSAPHIQVQGHRGARMVLPENTLPAFEYAIQAGADVLELDLAVTRDGVLVVSHDATMNPKYCTAPEGWAGTRVIREMTLAELKRWDCGSPANRDFPRQKSVPGTRVPTLDEVLALAPRGSFHFNVELKSNPRHPEQTPPAAEFARMVADVVRAHKLTGRVNVQSFDFRNLTAMKEIAPEIRMAALFEPGSHDVVNEALAVSAAITSPHYSYITPELVARAHKAGLQVIPWTANDEATWKRLVDAGVDAIITDDPAALIAYLKR